MDLPLLISLLIFCSCLITGSIAFLYYNSKARKLEAGYKSVELSSIEMFPDFYRAFGYKENDNVNLKMAMWVFWPFTVVICIVYYIVLGLWLAIFSHITKAMIFLFDRIVK